MNQDRVYLAALSEASLLMKFSLSTPRTAVAAAHGAFAIARVKEAEARNRHVHF
jgi:hypothetical protein